MFPIPIPEKEKGLTVGLCLRNVKPEYIVQWAKRYPVHSYLAKANIYTVFVVQNASYHEILVLIQEYLGALEVGKLRVIYKYNTTTETALHVRSGLTAMPLPYLDVYLSHDNL